MAPAPVWQLHGPVQGKPLLAPPLVLPKPRDGLETVPVQGTDGPCPVRPTRSAA